VVLFDRYHTVFRARGILEKRRKKGSRDDASGAGTGGAEPAPAGG
jgi:hypothetical protein